MTRPVSHRVRRPLAAGVATLALIALAGCGGKDEPSSASDTTSSSTSASSTPSDAAASGSASASTSESASDSASAGSGSAQAGAQLSADEFGKLVQGALDKATTANVTISSGTTLNATGQIDYTSDPASAKMTATIPQAGKLDMILLGKVIYMKGDVFGTGDKWVKLDLSDPNNPMSALGDQLDPAASLGKLVDGIQSATYVGKEDVDGDSLDHYTAVIDTKALLKGLPAGAASSAGLPATVNYELWFDGDGFIRKFSVDMGATGTSTGTFSDWGTKVDIAAPPASEVTTMPGM